MMRQGGDQAIVAVDLSKTFHRIVRRPGLVGGIASLIMPRRVAKVAVDRVSMTVRRGEMLALLGPNGAGKSTTIKMLTGILVPSAGHVRVAGIEPHRDRIRNARNIGAVFGQRTQLWWDLPVRDSLSILRDIFEVPETDYRRRLGEFDELLGLSEFWNTPVRQLSLGQRVRADVAASLLHDPMIVFLDEPTIGMDVVVKEQVREFLKFQVEHRGRTVLLTTHDMTEVNRLADRLVLINSGRIVFQGTLDELRMTVGGSWRLHVTLADSVEEIDVPGMQVLFREGLRVVFGPSRENASVDPTLITSPQDALRRVIERYVIKDMAIEESDLEEVMRAAYRRDESALMTGA
jgi:ABC-2 type transport system ATP-binding protein